MTKDQYNANLKKNPKNWQKKCKKYRVIEKIDLLQFEHLYSAR